jgi:hypothetical protein
MVMSGINLGSGCTNPNCIHPQCMSERRGKLLTGSRMMKCAICEWFLMGIDWEDRPIARCKKNGFHLVSFISKENSTCPLDKW